jgi:hypothetical protein
MAGNRELAFSGDDITEARLRALESERDLEQLIIWGGPVTNERLEPLSRLTWLKGLVLGESAIDDGVFRYLMPLRELEYLNLAYTNIAGNFGALEGIPLRDVRLEGCGRIGDACTASLARFPTLRQLEIHMTRVTDKGLRHLANSSLEVLWLGPRITDEGMQILPTMTGLRHLDICAPGVTDRGIRALPELKKLEVLWLAQTRTTDDSVDVLSQLRGLRELAVGHTRITEAGKARLRQALPQCRLVEEP